MRGLRVSFLEVFLRQERNRVQAQVEKTSYAPNIHISYVFSLLFRVLVQARRLGRSRLVAIWDPMIKILNTSQDQEQKLRASKFALKFVLFTLICISQFYI